MPSESKLASPLTQPFLFAYQIAQDVAARIFAPNPPDPRAALKGPRIAIIGAGITGVTAAAHAVGHGFEVTIFEAGDEDSLGGIWSRVNNTSSLQIHSLMYRFHPTVKWERGYPDRHQIVEQVRQLWYRYGLDSRTKFNTKIERVYKDAQGKWVLNDPSNGGTFDGLIAAVGTCGEPIRPEMEGLEGFRGEVWHSSQLTGKTAENKTLLIVGGGASAVEVLEFGARSVPPARKIYILARSDKWIIPRNLLINALLAMNIFGQEIFLSFVPEFLLRKLFYRDLEDLAPPRDKGIFMDTPMVNSDIMGKLRGGEAEWVRCDIERFTQDGVVVNQRARGVPQGGPGNQREIRGDMVVLATGYKRPSLDFLPRDGFAPPYAPPNWYLQTFPPDYPSVSAINCTYLNAIGTVGNWHIGIYTRILLMFLLDPLTRPRPFWMRRWIDMTRVLKVTAPTGAFDFFTYLELVWWFVFCVSINPFRWKWALFVFFGLGGWLPKGIVGVEERIRNGLGYKEGSKDVGKSF